MVRNRLRIRFTKQDDLRWLSHHDLVRAWERLLRRAGVPLGMTEGFHPKPRMNFPSALAVGIAGSNEMVEIELSAPWTAEQLRESLVPHLPPGLSIESIEQVQFDAVRRKRSELNSPRPCLPSGNPTWRSESHGSRRSRRM